MRHIVLVVLAFWSCVYASSLRVAVPEDVWLDYLALVDGREPLSIVDYRSAHARRDTVELLLLQQALAEGGWQGELDWQVINSYERILLELSVAGVDVGATSMWVSDLLASGLSWSLPFAASEEALAALAAFNQGLAILRLQGRVESAYLAAGFFQPLVSDWRVVNP